jgi:hypothetical protein
MSVEKATGRLVFRSRMDTIKGTIDSFKRSSALEAFQHQIAGFGHNNRTLLRNFLGIPR